MNRFRALLLRLDMSAWQWGAMALTLLALIGAGIVNISYIPGERNGWPLAPQRVSPALFAGLPSTPEDQEKHAQSQPDDMLSPQKAREINSAIPFLSDKGPAARPFRLSGAEEDRGRAIDCLASAALYEAGPGDPEGQRAVMQVVLNRTRHPAFPHSVCGVVFQGSERTTGCQFTFTCDGALGHSYGEDRWREARRLAEQALSGQVFGPVGLSTHYHTDWVHPYWSAKLDKLVSVHSHLFFRWRGYWGTRNAFSSPYLGQEPRIEKLAFLPSHRLSEGALPAAPATTLPAAQPLADTGFSPAMMANGHVVMPERSALPPERFGVAALDLKGAEILFVHPQGGAFLLAIPPGMTAALFDSAAAALCGTQQYCRVQGWKDIAQVPRGFPIPPSARIAMAYEFVRDSKYAALNSH